MPDKGVPLGKFLTMLGQIQEQKRTAHQHAETFAQTMRVEIEMAKKAGACRDCILETLIELVGEEFVGNTELSPASLMDGVQAVHDAFGRSVLRAVIQREARDLAGKPAP